MFVNEALEVRFEIGHSVHDPEPTVAHEVLQPTNGDREEIGLPQLDADHVRAVR